MAYAFICCLAAMWGIHARAQISWSNLPLPRYCFFCRRKPVHSIDPLPARGNRVYLTCRLWVCVETAAGGETGSPPTNPPERRQTQSLVSSHGLPSLLVGVLGSFFSDVALLLYRVSYVLKDALGSASGLVLWAGMESFYSFLRRRGTCASCLENL